MVNRVALDKVEVLKKSMKDKSVFSWVLSGEVIDINWGNTSITKESYTDNGYIAFSASGSDGFLPFFEHEGEGVVLSAIGANCGKCFYANGKWTAIKNTITFTPKDKKRIDFRFLYYYLNQPDIFRRYGGGQPFITLETSRNLQIPLPPLSEQKRIASLLARADRLRGLRRAAREQCDSLLQSVFLEMFGNINENNKGWHTTTIGQSMKLKSGDFLSSEMMDTRGIYPVYGGNGINGYHSAYMFDEPKICIGRVGVYCGAVHVTQQKSWITDNALYIEEIPANLNLVFLANYLKFKNLNQFADQAGQPLISQGRLTNVDIWLPSRILQEEFARVVARVEALRARMDESARQGEALFQSLLAESFG